MTTGDNSSITGDRYALIRLQYAIGAVLGCGKPAVIEFENEDGKYLLTVKTHEQNDPQTAPAFQ